MTNKCPHSGSDIKESYPFKYKHEDVLDCCCDRSNVWVMRAEVNKHFVICSGCFKRCPSTYLEEAAIIMWNYIYKDIATKIPEVEGD